MIKFKENNIMKKLVLGVTVAGSSKLLDGQVKHFKKLGYVVYILSPQHLKETSFCEREGCIHLPIDIEKEISPLKDLKTLFQIIKHLKSVKPDIINLGTPKVSLLGMLAAYFCGVKNRVYGCWGLRFETEKGLKRSILILMEWTTAKLATKVIYISNSLYTAASKNGIAQKNKAVFIRKGSSNGLDLTFFNRPNIDSALRSDLISLYKLENCLVIGFVGRVSEQKGAIELVGAFEEINKIYSHTRLIMMGHVDATESFKKQYESNTAIIHIPFQNNVPLYMSLFDIFVLPSWREGFPNVPIQAAAMGIPAIVSDATGCIDSIDNGVNGKVFEMKNQQKLKEVLIEYITNESLRLQQGRNGIEWAKNFDNETVWEGIEEFYKTLT